MPPATDLGIAPASAGDGALGSLAALAGLSCLAFLLAGRSGRIRRW